MNKRTASQPQVFPEAVKTTSLRTLEQRLDDGYRRIENGQRLGADVTLWEDFWIDLLHQYERIAEQMEDEAPWNVAA